jgi:hypothetical protein
LENTRQEEIQLARFSVSRSFHFDGSFPPFCQTKEHVIPKRSEGPAFSLRKGRALAPEAILSSPTITLFTHPKKSLSF